MTAAPATSLIPGSPGDQLYRPPRAQCPRRGGIRPERSRRGDLSRQWMKQRPRLGARPTTRCSPRKRSHDRNYSSHTARHSPSRSKDADPRSDRRRQDFAAADARSDKRRLFIDIESRRSRRAGSRASTRCARAPGRNAATSRSLWLALIPLCRPMLLLAQSIMPPSLTSSASEAAEQIPDLLHRLHHRRRPAVLRLGEPAAGSILRTQRQEGSARRLRTARARDARLAHAPAAGARRQRRSSRHPRDRHRRLQPDRTPPADGRRAHRCASFRRSSIR